MEGDVGLSPDEARTLGRIEEGIGDIKKTLADHAPRIASLEKRANILTGVGSVLIAIFAMFHIDLLAFLKRF